MEAWIHDLLLKIPGALIILPVLGGLVVIGQAVVLATPSTNDDVAWEKLKAIPVLGVILSVLASFAPIQKK